MADQNRSFLPLAITFLVGVLVGWFLLGWLVAPVKWTNAQLSDLAPTAKQQVVAAEAAAYALTQDNQAAVRNLQALGTQEEVASIAGKVMESAQAEGNVQLVDRVRFLASSIGLNLPEMTAATGATAQPGDAAATPATEPASQGAAKPAKRGNGLLTLLGVLLLLAGLALAAWLLLRRAPGRVDEEDFVSAPEVEAERPLYRPGTTQVVTSAPAAAVKPAAKPTTAATLAERSMIGQEFIASFSQGDEDYDESFDIEGSDGTYWGECGVTVSELLQGDDDRVTALEVWLFDKSDIRTVTKVLMSDYAYGNQALREKLVSRGDAVLLAPNLGFVLDAQTLRLTGKILDLEYDNSRAPALGTLRRLRVQLRVMQQPN